MDTVSYVLAMEEISKVDASASVVMSVNNSLVCGGLEKYGSEEQKKKYLTRLATGEIIGHSVYPNLKLGQMPPLNEPPRKTKETTIYLMAPKIGSPMVIVLCLYCDCPNRS